MDLHHCYSFHNAWVLFTQKSKEWLLCTFWVLAVRARFQPVTLSLVPVTYICQGPTGPFCTHSTYLSFSKSSLSVLVMLYFILYCTSSSSSIISLLLGVYEFVPCFHFCHILRFCILHLLLIFKQFIYMNVLNLSHKLNQLKKKNTH